MQYLEPSNFHTEVIVGQGDALFNVQISMEYDGAKTVRLAPAGRRLDDNPTRAGTMGTLVRYAVAGRVAETLVDSSETTANKGVDQS